MSAEHRVSSSVVEATRAFSRFYTNLLGVLNEGLLGTSYSLTEARVIFELSRSDVTDVATLRKTLELDSGYLSRVLSGFERDGLIERERAAHDARRQSIRLTDAGKDVFRMLDSRSVAQVQSLLAPLSEDKQYRLAAAMGTITGILSDEPAPTTIVLRGLRPGDLGWVVQRHAETYSREYGWDRTFEAMVARIVADYVDSHLPQRENAWIAELNGERAGCVFCVRKHDEVAQLRLLLVEPWARGHGIGTRLVDECMQFAAAAGYERIALWTNDILTSACRIYAASGFELVGEEAHHSFGKDLVGQFWERGL